MDGRRDFLKGAMGVGAAALLGGCQTGGARHADGETVVFISDVHVTGDLANTAYAYTRDWLKRTVDDILAIRPRCVVSFGDLCFDHGDPRDYAVAAKELRRLADAGIPVHHATGNHDRRPAFAAAFPEAFARSKVKGYLVSDIDLGACDLILLDTLAAKAGQTSGEIAPLQQEWLKAELTRRTRPFLIGAHHPIAELALGGEPLINALVRSPRCCGWINGHEHQWLCQWLNAWKLHRETLPTLMLPSAGLWGDIGYCVARVSETGVKVSLVQKDYFNPVPGRPDRSLCAAILRDHANLSCEFPFR